MPRPMVPDEAMLEKELRTAVRELYLKDRDALTVNSARQAVEKKLKLKDGFFRDDEWKVRSKDIIHAALVEAEPEASQPPQASPQPTPKEKTKAKPKPKPKPKSAPAKKKRAARAPTSDEDEEEDDSVSAIESLAEFSDSTPEPTPEPKSKNVATNRKRAQRVATSDDESSAEPDSPNPAKKRKLAKPKPAAKPDSEDSSPLSEPLETPKEEDTQIDKHDDGDSDTSVVYDEAPKKKGKKATASEAAPKKRKSQGPKTATPAEQTPDDALIKQLQGQLVKCGVRKIWGIELKKYGDDRKAKIRHLKGMLSDVGMTGRFSEAKAREIKEQRELLAELEVVKEGEKNWGISGRSARRRPPKNLKEQSDDDEEENGHPAKENDSDSSEDTDSDEDVQPKVRGTAKRRQDLAFLGDESESD